MRMTKALWEEFWTWLTEEAIYEFENDCSDWMEDKKKEWEKLERCVLCGYRGVKRVVDSLHSYPISEKVYCQECNKYTEINDTWDEAVTQAKNDINSGKISPRQILGIVESFKFVATEFSKIWIQELIIEKNAEKWDLLNRMNRKIENDSDKEE